MSNIIKSSKMLVVLIVLYALTSQVDSRFLSSFSVRTSPEDLTVSAAEPRPLFVELEKHPQVLPLVADLTDFSDSPSEASETVEKVLRRPAGFSYRNQHPTSSKDTVHRESEVVSEAKIVPEESQAKEIIADQKPAAIDYYKHIKKLDAQDDDGAGTVEEEKANEEVEQEEQSEADDSGQSNGEQEIDHQAIVEEVSKENEDHENLGESDRFDKIGFKDERNRKDDSHENYDVHEKGNSGAGGHGHGKAAGADGGGSHGGKDGGHKSGGDNHGNGGAGHGGGGGNGKFEKGGGKEHHEHHESSSGEKGDKGYKGHHHDEKGQKGHHIKEDHAKEFAEKGGSNKKHHHDDGYHAEHHHGEKGEKGHKFSEEGNHSKGHSTKGEHNIRKKEEYEKKQEFFDENNEEGDFEKDGSFFHEDDFHKEGFEKGGHKKGDHEEGHYGKKHSSEKGGHHKEHKGHKGSGGHNSHHDHINKHGEKESHSGGKKWKYNKGTGDGAGGHGSEGGGHGHGGGEHGHGGGEHGHGGGGHGRGGGGHGGEGGGHGHEGGQGGKGSDHGKYSVHESFDHDAESEDDGTHADIHDTVDDDEQKESADIESDGTELDDDESRIVLKRNYSFDGIPLSPRYSEVSKDKTLQEHTKLQKRHDSEGELIQFAKENKLHGQPGAYKVYVLGDYTTSPPHRIETPASNIADVVSTSETQILQDDSFKTVAAVSSTMAPIIVKDTSIDASQVLIMFVENESAPNDE